MPSEVKNGTPDGLSFGQEGDKAKDYRQMCKYGKDCYQKNPMHHQKFRHPKEDEESNSAAAEGDDGVPSSTGAREEDTVAEQKEEDCEEAPPAKRPREDAEPEESAKANEFSDGDRISTADLLQLSNEERIKRVYKMSMPDDFYALWEYCYEQNREDPWEALSKTYGLRLVGPFELLTHSNVNKKSWIFDEDSVLINDLVCHNRYYHDPPELQTVLASVEPDNTLHFGYFRDDPKEAPAFVTYSGGPKKDEALVEGFSSFARLHQLGDNLFGAMYHHIQKVILKADPFRQTALQKLKEALHVHATLKNQDSDFSLDAKTTKMKARDRKKLAQTFHGAGMVVPFNKDTEVGYREIPETTPALKKIFRKIIEADKGADQATKYKALDVLQELITNVQFANDEGDPGMGLELGLDAFVYGGKALNSSIRHLLSVGYELLNRPTFGEVVTAHLLRRDEANPVFRAAQAQEKQSNE